MMPTCNLTARQAVDGAIVFPPICKNGFSEQTVTLQNTSRFPIQFRVYMDSQNTSQMLLYPERVGIFTCDPPDGLLQIGDETHLTVRFNPTGDKTSLFQDNLALRLFGDNKKYGECKLEPGPLVTMLVRETFCFLPTSLTSKVSDIFDSSLARVL